MDTECPKIKKNGHWMSKINGGINLKFLMYDNEGICGILEGKLTVYNERKEGLIMFVDIPVIEIREFETRNFNRDDLKEISFLMAEKNSEQYAKKEINKLKETIEKKDRTIYELKKQIDTYEEKQKVMEKLNILSSN